MPAPGLPPGSRPPRWLLRAPRWWGHPAPRGMVLVLTLMTAAAVMATVIWTRALSEDAQRDVVRVERILRADVCGQIGIVLQALPADETRRALLRLDSRAIACGYVTRAQLDGLRATEQARAERARLRRARAIAARLPDPEPPSRAPRPRPRVALPAPRATPAPPPRRAAPRRAPGRPRPTVPAAADPLPAPSLAPPAPRARRPGPPAHSNAPPHARPPAHSNAGGRGRGRR